MLEIKDEEDDPSMSLDMAKLLDFCCKHQVKLSFYFQENENRFGLVTGYNEETVVMFLKFSDLYYPKNLLRTLKEKVNYE